MLLTWNLWLLSDLRDGLELIKKEVVSCAKEAFDFTHHISSVSSGILLESGWLEKAWKKNHGYERRKCQADNLLQGQSNFLFQGPYMILLTVLILHLHIVIQRYSCTAVIHAIQSLQHSEPLWPYFIPCLGIQRGISHEAPGICSWEVLSNSVVISASKSKTKFVHGNVAFQVASVYNRLYILHLVQKLATHSLSWSLSCLRDHERKEMMAAFAARWDPWAVLQDGSCDFFNDPRTFHGDCPWVDFRFTFSISTAIERLWRYNKGRLLRKMMDGWARVPVAGPVRF